MGIEVFKILKWCFSHKLVKTRGSAVMHVVSSVWLVIIR